MLDVDGDGKITQERSRALTIQILDRRHELCCFYIALLQADLEGVLSASLHRHQTARTILQSGGPDSDGGVDFKAFCSTMLPTGVDPSLAEQVAKYMLNSFV